MLIRTDNILLHTAIIILKEKLMKQKKMKTLITRSESRTALRREQEMRKDEVNEAKKRRTRDEKRYKE
ncbi:SH3 and multiple ankyrin repeat domains protein [Trichinella pseudospiralis]